MNELGNVNKEDFYYGAFLSKLTKSGTIPVLIQTTEDGIFYRLTSQGSEAEQIVLMKYRSKPDHNGKKVKRWDFSFTKLEIQQLKQYHEKGIQHLTALICGVHSHLPQSEIAVLNFEETIACIGITYTSGKSRRITVREEKYAPGLKVYGTSLADKDFIRVDRDFQSQYLL
ncbi:hypothetical protein [Marinilactibacillus sp. Marseille-P9653]|uniref:hypothetical protein n=1 Tax=Marinilactibacillus sp. Marseille-P9653 TaxID=2866583 RepID=UPI001CE4B4F9|nr:hypothetical protein [Marinilactibacillus sp. Marseille-P9653]